MNEQPWQHPANCDCDDCGYENHTAHVTIRFPALREKVKAARKRKKEKEQPMPEQKRAQHAYAGTLTRILHTRAIDDHDLIVVGSHSYAIPEVLYPTLDTLHCGDDVTVTYEVSGRVTGLVKKEHAKPSLGRLRVVCCDISSRRKEKSHG